MDRFSETQPLPTPESRNTLRELPPFFYKRPHIVVGLGLSPNRQEAVVITIRRGELAGKKALVSGEGAVKEKKGTNWAVRKEIELETQIGDHPELEINPIGAYLTEDNKVLAFAEVILPDELKFKLKPNKEGAVLPERIPVDQLTQLDLAYEGHELVQIWHDWRSGLTSIDENSPRQ